MSFPQRLYELRKNAGLSQEELAGLLGVTRQAVQKWEAGASRPDMDNLVALSRHFGVTLDWLIIGKEEERRSGGDRTVVVENHYHYTGWSYEYKSRRTVFGLPLVHIKLSQRGLCVAKGIIAIGNVSVGLLSIGCFSLGLVSAGALALGLAAAGGISAGLLALGGCALGYFAVGGSAVGVYALGGAAAGASVAMGGAASGGLLAIGEEAGGPLVMGLDTPREMVAQALIQTGTPGWVRSIMLFFLG